MSSEVWIVGRSFWQLEPAPDDYWHWTWDFHGVFSDREKAEALCKDQHWFIIPVEIDEPLPEEPYQFCCMVVPNRTKADPLRHKRGKRHMGCDFAKGKDIVAINIRDVKGNTSTADRLKRDDDGWFLIFARVPDGTELELLLEVDRSPGTGPSGFNAAWLRVTIHYHGDRPWAYLPTTGLPMRAEVLPTALFRWPTNQNEEA